MRCPFAKVDRDLNNGFQVIRHPLASYIITNLNEADATNQESSAQKFTQVVVPHLDIAHFE